MNKKVGKERDDAVLLVYHLDMRRFKSEFANRIIHQSSAKGFNNEDTDIDDLKNYVHRELLDSDKDGRINHPWSKFNFALLGRKNHERFNECIVKVELCDMRDKDKVKAKRDEFVRCRPLQIGVGKEMEEQPTLKDLGSSDGYYEDGAKKSVTSKHTDQYQAKYDKKCEAIPPPKSKTKTTTTDDDADEETPLFDLFSDPPKCQEEAEEEEEE